jgi:Universal stress protein family
MFGKILHANDGSEHAFRALALALAIAKQNRSELHVVCVEEIPFLPEFMEEVRESAGTAARYFHGVLQRARGMAEQSQVHLDTHVLAGHPVGTSSRWRRTSRPTCWSSGQPAIRRSDYPARSMSGAGREMTAHSCAISRHPGSLTGYRPNTEEHFTDHAGHNPPHFNNKASHMAMIVLSRHGYVEGIPN